MPWSLIQNMFLLHFVEDYAPVGIPHLENTGKIYFV